MHFNNAHWSHTMVAHRYQPNEIIFLILLVLFITFFIYIYISQKIKKNFIWLYFEMK